MESNFRYYQRRAHEEMRAAARAVTPEAKARRRALAESFAQKASEYLPSTAIVAADRMAAAGYEAAVTR
ncbi:MAG TPA: hypothetical protein VEZ70_08905 [Allosphingosinicella sp.]|nr:hypothetical protein [Allosphingosinicella sp.]